MKQTAVEWLFDQLPDHLRLSRDGFETLQQAKEMEKQQKLKHQLFIGKVFDIIGFEKTIELLKECNTIIGGYDAE
jgi:hypothetical protein